MEPEYIARHFVPLALDTYFRGNSHELEFCQKVRAGGNHLVVATAAGQTLGKGALKLRQQELDGVLKEFAALPQEQRTPAIADPATAQPPRRAVPRPPANGLILRGYCTYLRHDDKKNLVRSTEFYYKQNPDRWKVETQSDLLWLTESERKSLILANPRPGDRHEVAEPIQKRFYSTIGIDYMQGSVSALPTRKSTMSLIVDKVDDDVLVLRLEGYAHLGNEFDGKPGTEAKGRGSELRLLGTVHYDRRKQAITRFDAVGVGRAWGRRTNEIRLDQYPWMYGIAIELVTGDSPQDLIPPYNLLHYNPTGPYFGR
ncbi:MAG TPA: hypothetical protein VEL76_37180 [Gemmataceae bacterium]|nr:hypothetical protein [Gemmataceae bacterium]